MGGEPVNEHPDEPALHEKVTLKPDTQKLVDVEQALADAAKLTVVSDSFGGFMGMMPGGGVPSTEMELKDALDKIGDSYIYNWDKRKAMIELRDRNWFKKRAAQIPEAWLEKWRQELVKTGTIDIDSLAQIAVLTPEQISVNITSDDVLRSVTGQVYGSREMLRLYSAMSSDQRSAIFTDAGLDIASLPRDTRTQVESILQSGNAAALLGSHRPLFLRGTRTAQSNKSILYKFTLGESDTTDPAKWTFMTPTYTPPPAPKPKAADSAKPADAKPASSDKPK